MKYFDVVVDGELQHRVREDQLNGLCQGRRIINIRPVPWAEFFTCQVLDDNCRVSLYDCMGDDLDPLLSARISTGNPTGVDEKKDDALRARLWGDKHTSVFESVVVAFDLSLPLLVLRQLERHRTVQITDMVMTEIESNDDFRQWTSRNEFSARYSTMPDMFWVPPAERIQLKGTKNKQGSEGAIDPLLQQRIRAEIVKLNDTARELYDRMTSIGIASEITRVCLPGSQITKIRMQASLLNWLKFLALRLKPDVQLESRLYAVAISDCLKMLYPKSHAVFLEHTLNSISFNATEVRVIKQLFGALKEEGNGPDGQFQVEDADEKVKAKVLEKLGL